MNILTWVLIAFICGFLASSLLDMGKILIRKLRRVRLEIDLGNRATRTSDKDILNRSSADQLRTVGDLIKKTSSSGPP